MHWRAVERALGRSIVLYWCPGVPRRGGVRGGVRRGRTRRGAAVAPPTAFSTPGATTVCPSPFSPLHLPLVTLPLSATPPQLFLLLLRLHLTPSFYAKTNARVNLIKIPKNEILRTQKYFPKFLFANSDFAQSNDTKELWKAERKEEKEERRTEGKKD